MKRTIQNFLEKLLVNNHVRIFWIWLNLHLRILIFLNLNIVDCDSVKHVLEICFLFLNKGWRLAFFTLFFLSLLNGLWLWDNLLNFLKWLTSQKFGGIFSKWLPRCGRNVAVQVAPETLSPDTDLRERTFGAKVLGALWAFPSGLVSLGLLSLSGFFLLDRC